MIRRSLSAIVLTGLALGALACHPSAPDSPTPIGADSLRGIVSVTGTAFEQQIMLRSENGITRLSPSVADSIALSRVGGVEIVAVGKRTPNGFQVGRFTVISVAGSPVVDGVLRDDAGRLSLETTSGRVPLGNPPGALRKLIAARVWVGGPLDVGPNSFGVIIPPE